MRFPWARLLAEGTVIVVSILLALAGDAWWTNRQTEAARQTWLAGLEADLELYASQATSSADLAAQDRELARRFIAMTPQEALRVPEDSTWLLLEALWRPNSGIPNPQSIFDALGTVSDFDVGDAEIRRAAAEWRRWVDFVTDHEVRLWELSEQLQEAFSVYPGVQRAFAELEGARTLPGTITRSVRNDNEAMSLVARKAFTSQLQIGTLRRAGQAATRLAEAVSAFRSGG